MPPDHVRAQFPTIPDHSYTGLANEVRDPDFSVLPPAEGGSYPVLVGAKDADGNNVVGVRHPFLEAPIATTPAGTSAGRALRKARS